MKQEDKLRHIENVEKAITSTCFEYCFSKKKLKIDFDCTSTCYNKYLHSLQKIKEIVESEGRAYHSDFVSQSLGGEKRDRFLEEIFPLGGHPMSQPTAGAPILRRKFFENYLFSDPFKTGR